MLRLGESELAPSRKSDRGEQSKAFVADRAAELDSLSLELGNGRMDVVAHEIELVATGLVSRVSGELSGWEGEDEPAVMRVNPWELEDVPEEGAELLGILRVDDRVNAEDHGSRVERTGRVAATASSWFAWYSTDASAVRADRAS